MHLWLQNVVSTTTVVWKHRGWKEGGLSIAVLNSVEGGRQAPSPPLQRSTPRSLSIALVAEWRGKKQKNGTTPIRKYISSNVSIKKKYFQLTDVHVISLEKKRVSEITCYRFFSKWKFELSWPSSPSVVWLSDKLCLFPHYFRPPSVPAIYERHAVFSSRQYWGDPIFFKGKQSMGVPYITKFNSKSENTNKYQ